MQLETKAFGTIEIDEDMAVRLTEPMPGFPDLSRFAVLDPDPDNPFKWFQSVDSPEVCFLISDPKTFFPDYTVKLHVNRLPDLEIDEEADTIVAVIINLGSDPSQMTANLRAPLIFNLKKNLCRQIILDDAANKVRAPLFPAASGQG